MNRLSSLFSVILLFFAAAFFASCSKDDNKAKVMVVHASPDAPGVDILIDNSKVSNAVLTFPNNTGYLNIEPGVRNIKVNAAGTSTSVINADVTFKENLNFSIFAVNTLDKIEAVLVEDDLTAPASGKAHVRFAHLSPDAPAVDVALKGGAVLFPNFSFKTFSNFAPIDAGSYTLEVRLAGTQTVALELPPISLASGKIYTIFARGLAAGGNNPLGAEIINNN
mgnify:CR=1 FL=1